MFFSLTLPEILLINGIQQKKYRKNYVVFPKFKYAFVVRENKRNITDFTGVIMKISQIFSVFGLKRIEFNLYFMKKHYGRN